LFVSRNLSEDRNISDLAPLCPNLEPSNLQPTVGDVSDDEGQAQGQILLQQQQNFNQFQECASPGQEGDVSSSPELRTAQTSVAADPEVDIDAAHLQSRRNNRSKRSIEYSEM
jgi:hypothetical protein